MGLGFVHERPQPGRGSEDGWTSISNSQANPLAALADGRWEAYEVEAAKKCARGGIGKGMVEQPMSRRSGGNRYSDPPLPAACSARPGGGGGAEGHRAESLPQPGGSIEVVLWQPAWGSESKHEQRTRGYHAEWPADGTEEESTQEA